MRPRLPDQPGQKPIARTELLQHWVRDQSARRPEAVALVFRDDRLTYRELEEASNRLARALRAGGCRPGDRVCILMPKSLEAIVSILGILKADCVYVPLDSQSPAQRLQKVVESCEPSWILAGAGVESLLGETLALRSGPPLPVGWLGRGDPPVSLEARFSRRELEREPAGPVESRNGRQDPAYIFFTSGSTGTPKGVVITHSNVIHFIEWAVGYLGIDVSDRLSGHAPLHFDLSTLDIFGTFAAGAELHLVPPEVNLMPPRLVAFMQESRLTQWFSVPSVLNYLAKFDAVPPEGLPSLKRLLWCGEVLPTASLIYWMEKLPGVEFTNLYGPTEATVASSYYTVPGCPLSPQESIPIGTACAGDELLVLDERLRPVPPGRQGDLYIRGVGLSPGYWRDPVKTRQAFLPNPLRPGEDDRIYRTGDLAKLGEDGFIYFLGRADSQIKSRGYRIELGEIETALNALPSLEECAVVALPTEAFEGTSICCAYVPRNGDGATPVTLRQDLGKSLPAYMQPSRWLCLERLPRNPNGKIDRPRLREAFKGEEQTHE